MTNKPHVLLTTLGSHGDLNPYIALGLQMKELGFRVSFATHQAYITKIEKHGFDYVLQSPDINYEELDAIFLKHFKTSKNAGEFLIREFLMPSIKENVESLVKNGPYDFIITNTLTFATPIAADILGVPCISTVLSPISFFSKDDPPIFFAHKSLAALQKILFFKKLILTIVDSITSRWASPINQLRKDYGLPAIRNNILTKGYFRSEGTFILLPDFIVSPQKDWSRPFYFLGFPLHREPNTISSQLESFLNSKSKEDTLTVYTMGSILIDTHNRFFQSALSYHRRTKTRALFVAGTQTSKLKTELTDNDSHIFIQNHVDYHLVFSKASYVVHPGGIGTIGEAMSAGLPQVIVPFVNDQPENAARLEALGVSVTIFKEELSADSLEKAFLLLESSKAKEKLTAYQNKINENNKVRDLKAALLQILPGLDL